MPTNYLFGAGRLNNNASGLSVRFAPSTSSVISQTSPVGSTTRANEVAAPVDSTNPVSTMQNENQQIRQRSQAVSIIQANAAAKKRAAEEKAAAAASAANVNSATSFNQVPDTSTYTGPVSGTRQAITDQAKSLLGTGYAWGGGGYGIRSSRGTGLGTENVIGVDCSGLTSYAYGTVGVRLPRVAAGQLTTAGYKTAVKNLQPGDLVGWNGLGHVAIYLGNNQVIESAKPGTVVRIRSLGSSDASRGVFGVHVKLPGE